MSNQRPVTLGKYEVVEEIDRGSMGIVYLGYDPYADRPVAIKVAIAEQLAEPELGDRYRKMFFNEAHTAGRLTHPNIVGMFDAGVDGETCYLVMEYVAGAETLKNYSKPERLLDINKVVEIVFKCAKALDYAHRQGVIHRDIKPTNILLTRELDVKIGDFSIAHLTKMDSTSTMPMGLVGSPRYMSPEQVSEDYLTTQTDIFSLGIVMFELLTGKHPFTADNFSRLVQKILHEDPPLMADLRSDVPASLERIVRKALAKDRAERYRMGGDLAADLSRVFDNLLEQPREQITVAEQFNAVKRLDFFQGFPDSEVWEIVHAGQWQDYADQQQIIVEGELDDSFYIIVTGCVAVWKNERQLRVLAAGDCFGEMGYLAKTKRTATIIAEGQTSLLKINSTVISQVSLNCQVRFLKVFLRTLIYRLSITTEKMAQDLA